MLFYCCIYFSESNTETVLRPEKFIFFTVASSNIVIWKMLIKILLRGRQNMKIECTNACLQQIHAFHVFNYVGCHNPPKYFSTNILHTKM